MSTFIHGIGASENIDSSGEIVSIAGLDISSLEIDGVFNFEHKSDLPSQVVGKILKARKIFSDADCEDDLQLAFWNKVKIPYLYVMGELFDDYSDSAREVAGRFRYDADKKGQNERAVMNFSVEGAKIAKEGITVTRSIARKITITVLPCNKAAVAEMVAVPQKPKNNVDELFKTEDIEIEILQVDPKSKLWDLLKKEDPKKHADKLGIKPFKKDMAGGQISAGASTALGGVGPTSAGGVLGGEGMVRSEMKKGAIKPPTYHPGVYSSGKNYAEQKEKEKNAPVPTASKPAGKPSLSVVKPSAPTTTPAKPAMSKPSASPVHTPGSSKLFDPGLSGTKKSEMVKGQSHQWSGQEARTPKHRQDSPGELNASKKPRKIGVPKAPHISNTGHTQMELKRQKRQPQPNMPKSEMIKADTAGSGLGSPDRKVMGSAIAKGGAHSGNVPKDRKVKELQEKINAGTYKPDPKKIADAMLNHKDRPLKKSQWLQRAEAEYAAWSKREQFEDFMKSRMPHLTKGEIQVIGQTMLLQKTMKQEKALAKVAPSEFQHSFVVKKEK